MAKLLVSDYDGTLFNGPCELRLNVQAIRSFMDKGNSFVIATGRKLTSIAEETKKNDIPFNYLVCNDGNTIYDDNFNCLFANNFDRNVLDEIIDFLICLDFIDETSFYDADGKITNSCQVVEISGISISLSKIARLKRFISNYVPSCQMDIYGLICFFVFPSHNKADALKKLLKLSDEKFDDVIAVGNGKNDLEMLKMYDGYRMKNSFPELYFKGLKKTPNVRSLIKE